MGGPGFLIALVSAQFVSSATGDAESRPVPLVPRRTLDAVIHPDSTFAVSSSDAVDTVASFSVAVDPPAACEVVDGGAVECPHASPVRFTPLDSLSLLVERPGSLALRVRPAARVENGVVFVETPQARYVVRAVEGVLQWNSTGLQVGGAPRAACVIELQLAGKRTPLPIADVQSYGASMAWFEPLHRVVRVGGGDRVDLQAGTWVWDDGVGWVLLPVPTPPPRVRASLVADTMRRRLVLFGGLGATGLLDDLWEFDGMTWEQIIPDGGPAPSRRWSHGAAYDSARREMVLLGGLRGDDMSNAELSDTWTWDGTTWTEKLVPGLARDAFGIAWDERRQQVVVHGGWDGFAIRDDTWSWSGTGWVQVSALFAPPARSSAAMAWDPVGQRLVLAGGWDPRGGPAYFSDVWALGATGWAPEASLPQGIARGAMASFDGGVLLFGGRTGATAFLPLTHTLAPSGAWTPRTDAVRREGFNAATGLMLAGQRYFWSETGEAGGLVPAPAAWLATDRQLGYALVAADDAGLGTWVGGFGLPPEASWTRVPGPTPDPIALVSSGGDRALLLDRDLGLWSLEVSGWSSMATAPPGTRAVRWRDATSLYVVTDRLQLWTPGTNALADLSDPLPLGDGGVSFLIDPLRQTTTVVTGAGAIELFDGGLEFLAQPRSPTRFTDETVALIGPEGQAAWAPLRTLGARCVIDAECESSFCADGRCCSSRCNGVCAVCSASHGAPRDGECTAAPAGTVCSDQGCLQAFCDGLSLDCAEPVNVCPPDASVRDAGRTVVEPPPDPMKRGCGCASVEGLTALVSLALWWARRRQMPGRATQSPLESSRGGSSTR